MHRIEMTVEGVISKNPDQIAILLTDGNLEPYKSLRHIHYGKMSELKRKTNILLDRNVWAKTHGIEAMEIMYKEAENSGFLQAIPQNKTK